MDAVSRQAGNKWVIYQMMTRLFGNKVTKNRVYGSREENGVGHFDDITDKALDEIRKLGATHIWFTGVLEHASMSDYSDYGIPVDDADVVKGRAGSPYAVKDYYDVDPDLATDVEKRREEWEALIARTHKAGLGVIMDFVPNHVARAYASDAAPEGVEDFGARDDRSRRFSPQNNFYYLPGEAFRVPPDYDPLGPGIKGPKEDGFFDENPARASGNNVFSATPSLGDWFETVKLNYGIDYEDGMKTYFDPMPDTWLKMKDILLFWADKGVDAFRCDMAEMVPVEFWAWVIAEVKKEYPDLKFIAEIYQPALYRSYLHRGGFDFLYDKVGCYDALRALMEGRASAGQVIAATEETQDIDPHMLRFLENHDEQRIASSQFAGDARIGLPGMLFSAASGMGPVMIYFGQETGEPAAGAEGFQGDDGRTTIFDYWGVPEHQKWMNDGRFDGGKLSAAQKKLRSEYGKILNLCQSSEAVRFGTFVDLTPAMEIPGEAAGRVLCFARKSFGQTLFFFCNFSDRPMDIGYHISKEGEEALPRFRDAFTGEETEVSGDKIQLHLPAYGYRVLEW